MLLLWTRYVNLTKLQDLSRTFTTFSGPCWGILGARRQCHLQTLPSAWHHATLFASVPLFLLTEGSHLLLGNWISGHMRSQKLKRFFSPSKSRFCLAWDAQISNISAFFWFSGRLRTMNRGMIRQSQADWIWLYVLGLKMASDADRA